MPLLGTAVICEQTKPLPIGTQGKKNLVLANTPHLGTILLANPQYTPYNSPVNPVLGVLGVTIDRHIKEYKLYTIHPVAV